MTTAEKLYYEQVKILPVAEQLKLITLVAQLLSRTAVDAALPSTKEVVNLHTAHSIMELHGLGAEIWQNVDVQQYVDELRDEWD
ncbi:MAG TPA: hypothetical protein P5121_10795 [Caldilineaceae bacterium]|nr:hypothetical protein [Caldilineaceae bacterium]